MGDEQEWRSEAIAATNSFLLQLLYVQYFQSRPEGPIAAFSDFAGNLYRQMKQRPLIDMPADEKEAAVSDISETLVAQFLDGVAARLGIVHPE